MLCFGDAASFRDTGKIEHAIAKPALRLTVIIGAAGYDRIRFGAQVKDCLFNRAGS